MRFASVCSGIEAASVAWHPLGWSTAFVSEIDPFASAVLTHHYPSTPNYGDMTRFQEWPDAAFDLLVGGTPCQSFSVAGLRGGLADPRGNLMLTYGAIAARYRPAWLVWENVPGVLSSNGGRDFGAFLGMLGELGYGFAYRVLDAQYFGLAQRRKRVFVVGCLGSWQRAAAVLFERAGFAGHPAPSRQARQDVAGTARASAGKRGGIQDQSGGEGLIARCVTTGEGKRQDYETCTLIAHSLRGEGFDASEDGTGRGTPLVPVSVALRGREGGAIAEVGDDCAFALRASQGGGDKAHVLAPVAFDTTQITSAANRSNPKPGDPCHPIVAGGHAPAIAFDWYASASRGMPIGDVAPPLKTTMHPAVHASAVRRLTPRECERLQGFPDDYTAIRYRGKPAADGPRYKALGNSMAVPVMQWIGRRIAMVAAITATLAAPAAHAALPSNNLGAHIQQHGALPVRTGCAWSRPGGDPWHGDHRRALIAMGLSPAAATRVADRIYTGQSDGVVDFSADHIASRDGIVYAPRFATTFGQSVCLDSRVAFKGARSEPADRYTDGDATVVVARVCGNLGLLLPAGFPGETPAATVLPDALALYPDAWHGWYAPHGFGAPAALYAPHGSGPWAALPVAPGPSGTAPPIPSLPVSAPGTLALLVAGLAALARRRA